MTTYFGASQISFRAVPGEDRMRKTWMHGVALFVLAAFALTIVTVIVPAKAGQEAGGAARQVADQVSINPDDIGGVVTSSKGPEAGVWVIAETTELPTKFRKIVVTDDRGRYLLPELPKANYKVWARGYGLLDSQAVQSTPCHALALTAVI